MQSLISRLCFLLKQQSDDDEDGFEADIIFELIKPIITEAAWLAKDISGTHVLRSSICLLMGISVIAERRVSYYTISINLYNIVIM